MKNDDLEDLSAENEALKEEVARLNRQIAAQKKARNKAVDLVSGAVIGKPLKSSVSKFVDEIYASKLEKETLKDVVYATLHRLTKVGAITLILAISPLIFAILQTYYLKKQNDKLDDQNRRIEQQTFLQEAERRSSLVFLFDNVLDKLDDELKVNPIQRKLSPQLVGRIVSLSKALKPYRFLDGDTLTAQVSSPERGQLLISLMTSKLHISTYEQIFTSADFSYATLEGVNLDAAMLRNVNLAHSHLENITLVGADLSFANLSHSKLINIRAYQNGKPPKGAKFNFTNFFNAEILKSDFSASVFEHTNFAQTAIGNTFLREAFFKETEFLNTKMDSIQFLGTTFLKTTFKQTLMGIKLDKNLFEKSKMDTSTFSSLRLILSQKGDFLDRNQPKFHINRDTFYVGEKGEAVYVQDSFLIFGFK
jgi:Pentapeptide repeats (8 copies)